MPMILKSSYPFVVAAFLFIRTRFSNVKFNKMKKILFILTIIICLPLLLVAQKEPKVVTTSGKAQVTITEDLSVKQCKEKAKQLAIIDAIQNAFGTVIEQGNATYISNVQTGSKIETQTRFNTIANTLVKGEMVELLKEEYTELKGDKKNNITDWRCEVKIKAREIVDVPVSFETFTLSGNKKNNRATDFMDGDDMFLYFKSPVSGYVTVFVDDTKISSRMLPYKTVPATMENGMPVEGDKEYIFFSKNNDVYKDKGAILDELYLVCETPPMESWRIFVIFSKDPLNKPSLSDKVKSELKDLSSEEFQRWKNSNSTTRKDMQVQILDISIKKK